MSRQLRPVIYGWRLATTARCSGLVEKSSRAFASLKNISNIKSQLEDSRRFSWMTSIFSSLLKSGEIAQRITCLTFPASKQGSELLFPFEQEVWIIATAAKVSSRKHFISLFISQPSFPYEDSNHGRKYQKESFRNGLTDWRNKSMRHRGDVYLITFLITFGPKNPKKTDFFKIEKEERKDCFYGKSPSGAFWKGFFEELR